MTHFNQVVVHVLGCHVEARRQNGDNWDTIVSADCAPKGRVTQGLRMAALCEATHMSFGTGASMKGGIKEAALMRSRAVSSVELMADESMISFQCARALDEILSAKRARVDVVTQNTTEEIRAVFDWVVEEFSGHTLIIFVTSAFHAARATNEAAKVAHDLYGMVGGVVQYMVSPAYDSPGETFVLEESHRGDMKPIDWSPIKQAFGLVYDADRLQPHIDHFGEALKREKEGPSD